jgi:hypothetical protein
MAKKKIDPLNKNSMARSRLRSPLRTFLRQSAFTRRRLASRSVPS